MNCFYVITNITVEVPTQHGSLIEKKIPSLKTVQVYEAVSQYILEKNGSSSNSSTVWGIHDTGLKAYS